MIKTKNLKKHKGACIWDIMSKSYDKLTAKFNSLNEKMIKKSLTYLNPDNMVLEYGCGTGTHTLKISGHVKEIQAVDISEKMIEIARRKANEKKIKNTHFLQSTIFDERYKKESFDVILAYNVLHYFRDIQQHISRSYDLLKLGGIFISITPCSIEKGTFSSLIFSIFISFISKIGILPYIKFHRFFDLEKIIARGRFKIVETEKMGGPEEHYFIVAQKI